MLSELFKSINNSDIYRIKELIDVDYLAKFLALHALANNSHSVVGDNLKYVYDHTLGKFPIIYRIEDSINPISNSLENFNSSWFGYNIPSKTWIFSNYY